MIVAIDVTSRVIVLTCSCLQIYGDANDPDCDNGHLGEDTVTAEKFCGVEIELWVGSHSFNRFVD